MSFEDLTEDQLREYATNQSIVAQLMFQSHPSLLVELLGHLGIAKDTVDHMQVHMDQADLDEKMGRIQPDPYHDDLIKACNDVMAAASLAFETAVSAVSIYNDTYKNCKCPGCQRRRGVKVARNN